MTILIKSERGVKIPSYQTEGSAGADVCAFLPNGPLTLKPKEIVSIPTGMKMEIEKGFEVQVRPRSGLAIKNGITVLNSPGTIDSDYRGEVKIILVNFSDKEFTINLGDRIALLVVSPVIKAAFKEVDILSSSLRAEGGFGSTGI